MNKLKCTFRSMEWETLPSDAKQVGNPRGSFKMYLIQGIPHYIGSTEAGRKKKAAQTAEENHEVSN
jgi:hypothetical protein